MAKFVIEWTEESWNRVTIEADSIEQAREKFWEGDFDMDTCKEYGSEIQQNIDVSEAQ